MRFSVFRFQCIRDSARAGAERLRGGIIPHRREKLNRYCWAIPPFVAGRVRTEVCEPQPPLVNAGHGDTMAATICQDGSPNETTAAAGFFAQSKPLPAGTGEGRD